MYLFGANNNINRLSFGEMSETAEPRFNGQFRFCLRVHGCCVEFHNGTILGTQSLPSLIFAKLDRKTEAKFLPYISSMVQFDRTPT